MKQQLERSPVLQKVVAVVVSVAVVVTCGCCLVSGLYASRKGGYETSAARSGPTLRPTFTDRAPTLTLSPTVLASVAARPTHTDTPVLPATATAAPTETALPPSSTPTPAPPTATAAPPTATPVPPTKEPAPTQPPPSPTDAPPPTEPPAPSPAQVVITAVNKRDEYVDIQNIGGSPQDLGGWLLVSEKGNQACALGGVLQPGATLRIWAMASDAGREGFNCQFGTNIWNNSERDPAVLYNAQGQEVARY